MGGGKGGGGSAPDPDPRIGKAAIKNAELGKEWLEFAKIEAADASDRQAILDNLTTRIGEQQLSTTDRLAEWAEQDRGLALEDRDRALSDREKYQGWADQDRESSLEDRAWALEERDRFSDQAAEDRQRSDGFLEDYQQDRQRFAEDREATQSAIEAERAQADRDRQRFDPVEERMVSDAMSWDSDERMAEEAARAKADVISNASGQQQAQQRQMASMGINPNSGRFQGIDRATSQNTALQAAGAQNQARDNVRRQGLDLRSQAAQYGVGASAQRSATGMNRAGMASNMAGQSVQAAGQSAGMAGQMSQRELASEANSARMAGFGAGQYNAALGAAGMGSNAGQMAGSSQGAGVGTYGASINAGNSVLAGQAGANQAATIPGQMMGQGYQGAMSGNTSMMNGLNTQYNNQLQAWSANQQAAAQGTSGLMGAIGTGVGAYAAFSSSKDAKTNKAPVDGSALEAVKGLPVESWDYKSGEGDGGSHIGPYAEDFKQQTGMGSGKEIGVQDMMGLQLKAIQELGLKVDKLEGKKSGRRPDDIEADYEEMVA